MERWSDLTKLANQISTITNQYIKETDRGKRENTLKELIEKVASLSTMLCGESKENRTAVMDYWQDLKSLLVFYKGSGNLVSKSQLEDFFIQIGHFQANSVTDDMVKDLNKVLEKYQINTPDKIAMFMATIGHESKTGLVEVGVSNTYVVNGVDYRGGGYSQMTGYKYNYKPFSEQMAKEGLVTLNPDGSNPITSTGGGAQYVADHFAWESAGWVWTAQGNDINTRVDKGSDFYKVSQVINGGPSYTGTPNGWNERNQFYGIAQNIFK